MSSGETAPTDWNWRVPEPASLALLASGLAGLAGLAGAAAWKGRRR